MAGGGSRRAGAAEEAKIGTGNLFAALETLKKKKKKPATDKAGAKGSRAAKWQEPPKPEVYWPPTPLTTKSWADVEDDDDDYFATTAPPPRPVWGDGGAAKDRAAPALEEVRPRSSSRCPLYPYMSLFVVVLYGIDELQSIVEIPPPPFLFSLCSYMFVHAS
jgi:hypothetical protein